MCSTFSTENVGLSTEEATALSFFLSFSKQEMKLWRTEYMLLGILLTRESGILAPGE